MSIALRTVPVPLTYGDALKQIVAKTLVQRQTLVVR
jgi:hypothetical protein